MQIDCIPPPYIAQRCIVYSRHCRQARLKKKSKFMRWQPRWFRLDFVSLDMEYYADAQFSNCLGRVTFNGSSRHTLQNGILTLENVREVVKGDNKEAYALRHNDLQAMQWWDTTLIIAEQERKLRGK